MARYVAGSLAAIALVVLSAFGGGMLALSLDDDPTPASTTTVIQESTPRPTTTVAQTDSDIAALYAAVRPSVVRITGQGGGGGGLGSGVVIDEQGHILTNYHVIEDFDEISVRFSDGSAFSAEVVGTDPGNDLAIIQVDAPADLLEPAVLGDSDAVRVGETVIAIGNPFDIEGTLTEGVISGIGRVLGSANGRPLRQLIQSDAAINPGNSGGALFNSAGEVIGITTAIENPSGDRVFVGIGYAVPSNTAQRFLPAMLAGDEVQHPRLGVRLTDVTPDLAAELNLSVDYGVIISSVELGSAAAQAGLEGGSGISSVGDVIVAIDDVEVRTFSDLADYIDSRQVGDMVQVTVIRDGAEQTIAVTLEAWTG
jgi:S1-C subfamily serine protease